MQRRLRRKLFARMPQSEFVASHDKKPREISRITTIDRVRLSTANEIIFTNGELQYAMNLLYAYKIRAKNC